MSEKIYLNDLGIVNSQAKGKQDVLDSVISGKANNYSTVCINNTDYKVRKFTKYPSENCNRINYLLDIACEEISETVNFMKDFFGDERIGVIIGSTDNGSEQSLVALEKYQKTGEFPCNYNLSQQQAHKTAEYVKNKFSLKSFAASVSTACTSSGSALILAKKLIESSLLDAVIVGGVDIVSTSVLKGFIALEAVDTDITKPFSKNRKGINLGEGAALFVMSKKIMTDSPIEFAGYGESSDAYHATAPHPDGDGAVEAIKKALTMANIDRVDYVNLHGTGTILNDKMEAVATKKVFSEVPVASSTKGMIGHTLGAASAMELGFCWLILSDLNKNKYIPPHLWDGEPIDECKGIHFVSKKESNSDLKTCMSNSFAFGGCNISLIIRRGN